MNRRPTLSKIKLTGRDPLLPDLYLAPHHPLLKPGQTAIVAIRKDISPEAMAKINEWEAKQTIPKGSDANLKAQGASFCSAGVSPITPTFKVFTK